MTMLRHHKTHILNLSNLAHRITEIKLKASRACEIRLFREPAEVLFPDEPGYSKFDIAMLRHHKTHILNLSNLALRITEIKLNLKSKPDMWNMTFKKSRRIIISR